MKKMRLEPDVYEMGYCFSVTVAAANRAPVFAEPAAVSLCLDVLKESANKYNVKVYAFCFMPDHLHLLAGMSRGVSLVDFVRHFKQLSGYRLRRQANFASPIWQKRFYDHALRDDEALTSVAQYILENPVRAGIVSDAGGYPYSGSLVWADVWPVSGSEDPDLHADRRRVVLGSEAPDLHADRRRVALAARSVSAIEAPRVHEKLPVT